MQNEILMAGIGAGSSLCVSLIAYFVQRARLRQEFDNDVAQIRTTYMAEQLARRLLEQYKGPFRTFAIMRHHIGGFSDDELRRILVRAGALRFISPGGKEMWALYDRVRHYKASWDNAATNYLSVWKLGGDPSSPPESELFPAKLNPVAP